MQYYFISDISQLSYYIIKGRSTDYLRIFLNQATGLMQARLAIVAQELMSGKLFPINLSNEG